MVLDVTRLTSTFQEEEKDKGSTAAIVNKSSTETKVETFEVLTAVHLDKDEYGLDLGNKERIGVIVKSTSEDGEKVVPVSVRASAHTDESFLVDENNQVLGGLFNSPGNGK